MASFLDEIFGSKPATAPYVPTQLPPEQIKTLKANIAAFPDINQLGSLYEQYMLNEMGTAIPDFSNILASGGQLTEDMINQAASLVSGQVPQDVQDQIMRSDAFTSMLSGGGPAFDRSLTARDLGLTSLNLIQQGGQLAGLDEVHGVRLLVLVKQCLPRRDVEALKVSHEGGSLFRRGE